MDQRLVLVSRLFYEQQLSKTEIAKKLGISITHVGRLLKEAAKLGIVEVLIKPPRFEGLEVELKDRFNLLDALVVVADEQSLHWELGKAAAEYFDRTVEDRQSIGLGSGRTLFEMVSAIEQRAREISIYPLSVCADQDLNVKSIDANTVVKILWFKSGPHVATANRLELFFPDDTPSQLSRKVRSLLEKSSVRKFSENISDLDNYFFSCSSIRQRSQLAELEKAFGNTDGEEHKRPIGDIVFNAVDENGEYVSTSVEEILFRVSLATLRRVSSHRQKRVVLVAGGRTKVKVIRAGLRAKLFNTLITDNLTAEHLLQQQPQ